VSSEGLTFPLDRRPRLRFFWLEAAVFRGKILPNAFYRISLLPRWLGDLRSWLHIDMRLFDIKSTFQRMKRPSTLSGCSSALHSWIRLHRLVTNPNVKIHFQTNPLNLIFGNEPGFGTILSTGQTSAVHII
jgi:hypothetical protein